MEAGAPRYSVRIGESYLLVECVPYDVLLKSIMEFTIRAAVARSIDEGDWEHEQLRRNGLAGLQLFRGGRAVWSDRGTFEEQLAEARSQGDEPRFRESSEADAYLYERLDRDLRDRWRLAGYDIPSLMNDMKTLLTELERDARDRVAEAKDGLVADILTPLFVENHRPGKGG
jgi:hypothetical protein